jgi:hypothetical protein
MHFPVNTNILSLQNAFSAKLSQFGLDYHNMFVVDLLHEFELGVWKNIFTHLMRILHAIGGNTVQDLNKRYREVPPFGNGVIRRFRGNASTMRKLAARDFEDLLQVCNPSHLDDIAYHPHTVRSPCLRGLTVHTEREHFAQEPPV